MSLSGLIIAPLLGNPDSGVWEILGSGKFCSWDPKSWTLESGIQFKEEGVLLAIEI